MTTKAQRILAAVGLVAVAWLVIAATSGGPSGGAAGPGGNATNAIFKIQGNTNQEHWAVLGTNGLVPNIVASTGGAFSTNTLNLPWASRTNSGGLHSNEFSIFIGKQASNSVLANLSNTRAATNVSATFGVLASDILYAPAHQVLTGLVAATVSSPISTNTGRMVLMGETNWPGGLEFWDTNRTLRVGVYAPSVAASNWNVIWPSNTPSGGNTNLCAIIGSGGTNIHLIWGPGGGGSGDSIEFNSVAVDDASGVTINDTGVSDTVAGVAWTLNTGTSPDTASFTIGGAGATQAGIVTAQAQGIGGLKSFKDGLNALQVTSTNVITARGQTNDPGALSLLDTNHSLGVTIKAGSVMASNLVVRPPTNGPSSTLTNLSGVHLADGSVQLIWTGDNAASPASGDALLVNETPISDSGSLTNVTATATGAGVTWSVAAGTDPDPDKISLVLSAASASLAGIVTAQDQSLGGVKTFPDGVLMTGMLTVNDIFQRFPAKTADGVLTVTGTNSYTFLTATNFTFSFSGTPVNGQILSLAVSNYNVTADVFATNAAGIYNPFARSNDTIFVIGSNSLETFEFEFQTNFVAAGFWKLNRWTAREWKLVWGSGVTASTNGALGEITVTAASQVDDTSFAASWNGVTTTAPSKNAVYDHILIFDTDADGKVNVLDQGVGIAITDSSGVLQTPITDSAGLRGALSDESGTGRAVFEHGNIGDATAASLTVTNGITVRGLTNDPGSISLQDTNHSLAVTIKAGSVIASNSVVRLPTNGISATATNLSGVFLADGSIQLIWVGDNAQAGGGDADAIHDNVANEIAVITAKATPVGADFLLIEDSAASNAKKSATISALETPIEAVLDLQDLQGAVTDAQVPNTITVDVAATANAGDSATAFFSAGTIEDTRLPTTFDTIKSFGQLATAGGIIRLLEDSDNGANYVELTAGNTLAGNTTLTLPAATDTLVGKATTDTLTEKTIDASASGNVLKFKSYLQVQGFDLLNGATVPNTNDVSAGTFMKVVFSNSADETANYLERYLQVPDDIDTAVEPRIKLTFKLNGADTGTQRYVVSMANPAASAAYTGTVGTAINCDFAGDASGANNDVEQVAYTTLTGWGAALTAGNHWVIRIARDGNAAQDTSTVDSTLITATIEYPVSQ